MVEYLLMQNHQKKLKNRNSNVAIQQRTSQPEILILTTLQPNSTATNYTTNTTSYDLTQHEFPSSESLEGKQGKYHDES